MPTATVENYLKAMYTLCRESPTGEAGVAKLAAMLGVTKGTTTSMVKKLAEAKLIAAERYGGVKLTAKGTKAAIDVLRRHRLIETFLVETLKLDWTVVHAEADRLEHAITPVVLEALDAHLGHPSFDPHGDPIPSADGSLRETRGRPLPECAAGSRVRVLRITDQDADFLSFIASQGLKPGARATVKISCAEADVVTIQTQSGPLTLSRLAASKVLVE